MIQRILASNATAVSLVLFALESGCLAPAVYACASCGSGGGDPLILYPNEQWKVYVGSSQQVHIKDVDYNGRLSSGYEPSEKNAFTVATGMLLGKRSFATLTVPYMQNVRPGATRTGLGDASAAARYTVIPQSFDAPWLPQVQLILGIKPSTSHSIHDDGNPMTAFGNGYNDLKAGVDVWFGMDEVVGGLAEVLTYSLSRRDHGIKDQPGISSRTTVDVGYKFGESGKILVGWNHQFASARRYAGKLIANSDTVDDSGFATYDFQFTPMDTLRLTITKSIVTSSSMNSIDAEGYNIAFIKAFN